MVNISLSFPQPGLYFVSVSGLLNGTQVFEHEQLIPFFYTTDNLQQWRRKLSVENKSRLLLAFYYPWYGSPDGPSGKWKHWEPGREYASTHVPLIGFYDSRSDEVIRYHIRIAQSVGIDGFICSWWGPGNYIDEAFSEILRIAGEMGFHATIYLEFAHTPEELMEELEYVLSRYGNYSSFPRWDGRPVVFIYSRVLGTIPLEAFSDVFTQLRNEGLDAFYTADTVNTKYLDVFDALHVYSSLSVADQYPFLVSTCRSKGAIFAPTVCPGYDDRFVRDPGMVFERQNGSYYKEGWERVMLCKPDWVLLTSFNEWHEGTEVEPSLEHSDLYVNLTKEYYSLFEAGRLTLRWERWVREIEELFPAASELIQRAEERGLDTRFMKRDYTIAENCWKRYNYEDTKRYLLRILAKAEEIPETGSLLAALLLGIAVLSFGLKGMSDRVHKLNLVV